MFGLVKTILIGTAFQRGLLNKEKNSPWLKQENLHGNLPNMVSRKLVVAPQTLHAQVFPRYTLRM